MKHNLLLYGIVVLSCNSFAGQTGLLRGRVSDPARRVVARVRVRLTPGDRFAVTDSNGAFEIPGVAPGEYRVTASSDAFEPVTIEGIRVEPGSETFVEMGFLRLSTIHVQVDVIGSEAEAALQEIPGSAYLIERKDLAESHPADANEVLRQAPGVNIREDSGPAALRLNIGIRGLNPDRSRTLLVLEDGLPISLAPYGEPEMYYSPSIDRMSRVEILKGSGSILHGPQTVGGVLNFITPDPPLHPQGTLELSGGQYGAFTGQASYGGTRKGAGWYVNALRKQGDGWRDLYFDLNDLTSKLNLSLSDRQRLGFKLGLYDEKSNSTYLGLTEAMFRQDPNQNPVEGDLLRLRRFSGSVAHQYIPTSHAVLTTTAFAYATTRNWRRQDFDRAPKAGTSYLAVAGDPAIASGAIYLRDSSGNNNRDFDVAGLESRLSLDHSSLGIRQHLEAGVRYVYELHRDRRIDGAAARALAGVIREDEVRYGNAVSGFLQDRLFLTSRLTVTPGIRVESYDYTRHILRQPVNGTPTDVDVRRGDLVLKPIPGIGVSYQAATPLTLFAGLHRGFAPPRIKDAITRAGVSLQLDAELSWNYEAGARLKLGRGLRAEATWFTTDFQNQIVPAAVSGGATTTLVNAGRTLHRGVEFRVASDWDRLLGRATGFYTELHHTWLATARFTSGASNGFRLPYAPEHSFGARAGWRHRGGFSVHIDGTRVGHQFGDNFETVKGSADGTIGRLPAYWVWNASAGHEFHREHVRVSPFVTVKNLSDERYISSRAPLGIQPGMFRQAMGGLKFGF